MKTALIFGSSGLIGSELLNVITQNNNYNKIKLFVRSVPNSATAIIVKINLVYLSMFPPFCLVFIRKLRSKTYKYFHLLKRKNTSS